MKEIHSLKGSAEKAVKIFFAQIPFGKHFIQTEYDPEIRRGTITSTGIFWKPTRNAPVHKWKVRNLKLYRRWRKVESALQSHLAKSSTKYDRSL